MRIAAALLLAASLRAAAGEICAYDGSLCFDAPETLEAVPEEAFNRDRMPILFLQARGSIRDARGGYLMVTGGLAGGPRASAETTLAALKSSSTWRGDPGETVRSLGLLAGASAYAHTNGCPEFGSCWPTTFVHFTHLGYGYRAGCLKDMEGCLAVLRTIRPGPAAAAARPPRRALPSKSRVLLGLTLLFIGLVQAVYFRHRLRTRELPGGTPRSGAEVIKDYLGLLCAVGLILVGFRFMRP